MENSKNQIAMNVPEKLNRGIKIIPVVAATFIVFACISCATAYVQRPMEERSIMPPSWAPYYDNVSMVHYYYLPDIECYYDVWNHEFVYLEDGDWMFGATLPPDYSWFNLNSSFVVVLNQNVFEPWRHFHYYVSHYPRYYYETVYRNTYNDPNRPMRGFNENPMAEVFNNGPMVHVDNRSNMHRNEPGNQMNNPNGARQNPQPGNQVNNQNDVRQNQQPGNQVNNQNEARQNAGQGNNYSRRTVEPTHPAQRMDYYGKDIGRPVKVQKNMTEETQGTRRR
jgi:hypothetical protein